MPDTMTPQKRSECMSRIRSKDTRPEMIVRRALHGAGMRYRLHVRRLPGTPDIVLRRFRTVVLVNGCFWHGHRGCVLATRPKSNVEFWQAKIRRNQLRDEVTEQYLEVLGWKVITVWECELKPAAREATLAALMERIRQNGIDYAREQSDRRARTAEHRAMLRERKQIYEQVMRELEWKQCIGLKNVSDKAKR